MLFENAAAEYMADKSKRLRATTLEGYGSALRLHVLPRWCGVEVEDVHLSPRQESKRSRGWYRSLCRINDESP